MFASRFPMLSVNELAIARAHNGLNQPMNLSGFITPAVWSDSADFSPAYAEDGFRGQSHERWRRLKKR